MAITMSQLRAFVAVADLAHFTRAAQALSLSQPAVSKEIRRLEEEVGVVLFTRSARSCQLTAPGRSLLDHARQVLAALDALGVAAHRIRDGRLGEVRVVASPSMLDWIIPQVGARLDASTAGVGLDVIEADTGQVATVLADTAGDIALGHFVAPVAGYADQVIGRDGLVAMLAAHHPAARGPVDLRELTELPLLLWPREQNPAYYDFLVGLCRERGLDPYVVTSSSRILGARSFLVINARAFTLVPHAVPPRAKVVARELVPPAYLPVTMLVRHGASAAATKVAAVMREVVRAGAQ